MKKPLGVSSSQLHIVDIGEEVEYQENVMTPNELERWPADAIEDTLNNREDVDFEMNPMRSQIREREEAAESERGIELKDDILDSHVGSVE